MGCDKIHTGTSIVALLMTGFGNLLDSSSSGTERQVNAFLLYFRSSFTPTLPSLTRGCLAKGSACAHRTREMHLEESYREANSSVYNIPDCKNSTFS